MKAKMICYDLSKLDQIKKVDVKRVLFGYTEYSNNAKYTYKRKGVLDDIPHFRPAKAVVIVESKYGNKVLKALKSNKAKCKVYNINVNKSMLN